MIIARNRTPSETISCRITVDGTVVSEGESTGGFKLVRCEYLIPAPTVTPAG